MFESAGTAGRRVHRHSGRRLSSRAVACGAAFLAGLAVSLTTPRERPGQPVLAFRFFSLQRSRPRSRHLGGTCAPARGWTERPIKSTPFYPAAAHPCEHTLVAGARWWLRRVQPMALMVRAVDRLSTSSDGFLSSIGWSCPNRHRWFAELARSSSYGCDRRISGTLG